MRRDTLIQAAFCVISLLLLVGSYPGHAADVPFEKVTYRISANYFVDSMSLSMGFNAVEVLETVRQPGATSVDQKVSGTVNWPTTPGGFSPIPFTKYIEYRDNEGHVQKEVKVPPDTINTTWSFHNVILADGRVAKDITDDRASEVRFMVINTASLARHFSFMTLENLYWMGQGTRAYIGPGYAPGQEVEVWVTKWIPYPGLISPEVVKVKLSSLPGVKTAAGSFNVLVGGPPPFTTTHPWKVATGDLIFQYSYTFYWDSQTGILVKFDVVGHSTNPADQSDTRISYELVEMKASSGPSNQPGGPGQPPTPSAPAPNPPSIGPQVPPSPPAPVATGSSFAPNMTIIGLGAAVGVGAIVAFAALRTRGGTHGARGAKAGRFKSEAGSDQPFKGGADFKGTDFKGTDFKAGGTGFKAGAGHAQSATVKTEGQRASGERFKKMIARLDELKAQGKITNKVYEKLLKEYQEKMKAEEGEQ